jgi:GNAT superfamily N-acetyltransferase
MTIKLVQATGSPFDLYPQLQTIWPEPYNSIAHEISSEDSNTGEIYLITLDDEVVGITGVFSSEDYPEDQLGEHPENIYLRWTGVVPNIRKSGIGRAALDLLLRDVCPFHYPNRKHLVELVPHTDYGRTVVEPFFQKVGFVKHGPLERYDWIDHEWQPYLLTFK